MKKPKTVRTLWEAFDRGDSLSDRELQTLITQADAALSYLSDRGPTFGLAHTKTYMDLLKMRQWMQARKDPMWKRK